jgi:hypothetical protein
MKMRIFHAVMERKAERGQDAISSHVFVGCVAVV